MITISIPPCIKGRFLRAAFCYIFIQALFIRTLAEEGLIGDAEVTSKVHALVLRFFEAHGNVDDWKELDEREAREKVWRMLLDLEAVVPLLPDESKERVGGSLQKAAEWARIPESDP